MNKRNFINKICIADLEKLGVKCNITNKKLRSSNEQLKNLLELIREGVTFSDETGHFYIYNAGMEKLTGYSMKEANASPDFTSLLYPNLKEREMALRGIVELLEKRTRRDAEAVITTKSGELKNVCISSALIPHKERKLFLSVYQDITRRKKVEETLREAYNKLKEMQGQLIHAEKMEAIGRLASGVAHEVKNPLGIILQGINYLEGKISPDQKEMFEIVQMMKSNVKRADNIVGELLEFSRSGELKLQAEDINSILESSLSLVRHKINPPNIKVIKQLNAGLPKVLVDSNKIEQVFINLLLNAIETMSKGGKLFIRSFLIHSNYFKNGIARNGDYLKLEEKAIVAQIEDTGSGIPKENLERVFNPFFTTKGSKGGIGLGLAVTNNIISMHKGIINIESKVGKGTKISVILKID